MEKMKNIHIEIARPLVQHPEAFILHALADGATIQYRRKVTPNGLPGKWCNCITTPSFLSAFEYRVKPIPDVVVELVSVLNGMPGKEYANISQPNLRLTYNGFTGALKIAEVLL
jgi:hypothetical protein